MDRTKPPGTTPPSQTATADVAPDVIAQPTREGPVAVVAGAAAKPPPAAAPEGCGRVALLLQGGGALGAYQAGVFEALEAAGLEPNVVAGVSIGAVNAAILAGNPPPRRLPRLREFWRRVTDSPALAAAAWLPRPDGDDFRRLRNMGAAMSTLAFGQVGFFRPNPVNPWFAPRGAAGATAYYDTAPLRATLEELVDWDYLRHGPVRLAVGAVAVESGNFRWFDSAETRLGPEHVMASGALPPGLPMVRVGGDHYWDGGLVSNTPLQFLLEDERDRRDALVFQVDLFPARGPVPRDMEEVLGREKDIRYSSRTRMNTNAYLRLRGWELRVRRLLGKTPAEALSEEERGWLEQVRRLPRYTILHLIYRQKAYEGQAKDYAFGAEIMAEHWRTGLEDARGTLDRPDWLRLPAEEVGIVTHDVHRGE